MFSEVVIATSFMKLANLSPRRLGTGLLFLALMVIPGLLLHAQTSTTGDIAGSITDPAGSVIPNAKVVLTNTDTRSVTTTMTDAQGLYRFPLLKPGNYSLEASATGFQTVTRNVSVTLGSSVTANLGLGIQSVQSAPIFSFNGKALGTFVVAFRQPRASFDMDMVGFGVYAMRTILQKPSCYNSGPRAV